MSGVWVAGAYNQAIGENGSIRTTKNRQLLPVEHVEHLVPVMILIRKNFHAYISAHLNKGGTTQPRISCKPGNLGW